MIAILKNETSRKRIVIVLIGLAIAAVVLSGCNTVRGAAKDVTDVANALDPEK